MIPDSKTLARTYEHPSYQDPWDVVLDYQRVQEATAEHPEKGSHALSSIVELPRSRIRPWIEGSKPDVVRAVETAEERGWFVRDLSSLQGHALAGLVAWIFSGGSISDTYYVPHFTLNEQQPTQSERDLSALAERFNLELQVNERESGRATEFVPATDRSVLGRVLAAAGAPVGGKADQRDLQLPAWLKDDPTGVQRTFVAVYAKNRGNRAGEGEVFQISEQRPTQYLEELAELVESVAGTGTVRASKGHLHADRTATEVLEQLEAQPLAELLEEE